MSRANRATISTVLFVALATVATGLVASTIRSLTVFETGEGGERRIQPAREGEDAGRDFNIDPDATTENGETGPEHIDLQVCIEFLHEPIAILGILVGMFLILYVIQRRYNLAAAALFGTFLIPLVTLVYFFVTNCPPGPDDGGGLFDRTNPVSDSPDIVGNVPTIPTEILALLVAGVMLLAIVMIITMTGREETFDLIEEEVDELDMAEFARAAGLAADRIEEANMPVDNAVYKAWLEMTRMLDFEKPETAAPMDFADAAIELGFDSEDVYELTELFNEVRYGGKDAQTREDRAVEVFRRIEDSVPEPVDEAEEEPEE